MQHILMRRAWRELRANALRYLALAFMLILSMYIIVSLVGAADTIIDGGAIHAAAHNIEDGQFTVFVPLSDKVIGEIESKGVELEPAFYLDYEVDDGSVLRLFAVRERIDLLEMYQGSLPEREDQVALERRYCEVKGLHPGDMVDINGRRFEITGICTTPDYDAPYKVMSDSAVDSLSFGTAFVTPEAYRAMRDAGGSVQSEEYVYAYRLNGHMTDDELKDILKANEFNPDDVSDAYFRDYWKRTAGWRDDLLDGARELDDGANELNDALQEITDDEGESSVSVLLQFLPQNVLDAFQEMADGSDDLAAGMHAMRDAIEDMADEVFAPDTSNLIHFVTAADNPRIGAAADDQIINKIAGLLAGVILLVLLTYVISVFVVHTIEEESSVIGTLYALGVRRSELMRHYMLLPVLVTLLSGAIGTALGYSPIGVPTQTADCYAYFSVPEIAVVVKVWLVLYGVALPPVVAAVVNGLVICKKLSVPALRLMRQEQKVIHTKAVSLTRSKARGRGGFIARFQLRQLRYEARSAIAICLGMLVTLLLMMIGIDCYVMCEHLRVDNINDTRYEYMYLYKYPEKRVPAGGSAACAETLKKALFGYDLVVTVLGIEPDNPYFDAKPEKSMSRVEITSAMAQKYGIKVGDTLVLSDREQERDYAFTVSDIVQYSTSFFVFMHIDSMRELFDLPDDYFNMVFAAEDLRIPSGRLYSVTSRKDVVNAADVFVNLMKPMVYTMIGCSALIFAIVMYLMMKVTIDRSAYSIALIKIFGYRRGEIRRLYLDGSFAVVALGAAIGLPLSKWAMDAMYPLLISNVACGMDLRFTWQLYAGIYVSILILYFIISRLLVGRINRVSPVEVLKNRE